ncbi:hypothetical protein ACSFC0_16120 [Serratia marcescens]|uniref:hypothetical protein n=1 Tax=Serratia marcescens TaxID=615 RepID=UPI003EDA476A
MGKMTFIVDFPDGQEPAVGFATPILGGRLSFVAFEDIRVYQLTQDESQALTIFTEENQFDFRDCCEEYNADPDVIAEKLSQQAI